MDRTKPIVDFLTVPQDFKPAERRGIVVALRIAAVKACLVHFGVTKASDLNDEQLAAVNGALGLTPIKAEPVWHILGALAPEKSVFLVSTKAPSDLIKDMFTAMNPQAFGILQNSVTGSRSDVLAKITKMSLEGDLTIRFDA